VEAAIRRRLPSISGARGYADAGLLMTYGSIVGPENWRTVTRFVAKILRGAKPGDLPIERPTRFELVVNSKTASALGVTLPQALLDRADVVIR
jgi:putative ABC transport system substrate-binding protein